MSHRYALPPSASLISGEKKVRRLALGFFLAELGCYPSSPPAHLFSQMNCLQFPPHTESFVLMQERDLILNNGAQLFLTYTTYSVEVIKLPINYAIELAIIYAIELAIVYAIELTMLYAEELVLEPGIASHNINCTIA